MEISHTISIKRYISDQKQELLDIINKERRIMLVANPGTGKTFFASELKKLQKAAGHRFIFATFLTAIPKQLNTDFDFDLVCSSYEDKWNARIEALSGGGKILEDDELVIGTTLHQLIKFTDMLTEDDVIVIDEAHQLVQLAHVERIEQLRLALKTTKAKLLLMSGTPYEGEDKRLGLSVVKIEEENPRIDKLIYLPITEGLKGRTNMMDLTASLIHWHLSKGDNFLNQKILVYNNTSKLMNTALVETVKEISGFEFDDINADTRDTEGYQHLMLHQSIRPEASGIVTTSAIKEGVNIKNQDIEMIIVLGHMTLKDEKQVCKRIRGNKPIEVFRIYNEPSENDIDNVDFEIELVNLLVHTYRSNPKRVKKSLQRLANCGEILRSTGILDSDAETINEVKLLHIMETLESAKCGKKDHIERQNYNDLIALDGNQYLLQTYNKFLNDDIEIGVFTKKIKFERQKAQDKKDDELRNILLVLFGSSEHFELAIDLLKGDLVSYSTEGKLLQAINVNKIKLVSSFDYVNPSIEDAEFDKLGDDEIRELIDRKSVV